MFWILLFLFLIFALIIISRNPYCLPFFGRYSEHKSEYQKQQWVRLLDILILGPLAFVLAYQLSRIGWNGWASVLVLYAVGTILYNFGNFVLNRGQAI